MATYNLSIAALKAHLVIAATKDARFYLNAIFLDGTSGHLVSTDGGALLATKHSDLKGAPSVIMPRDVLARAVKQAPKTAVDIELAVSESTLTFTPAADITLTATAVDATYPQWRRVVPASCNGEAGNYDPSLLARVGDALQALGDTRTQQMVCLRQNGPDLAALVMLSATESAPPHVAVIMPVRRQDKDEGVTPERLAAVL